MSFIYQHVTLNRVIDGDTLVMSVDMGNKIMWNEHFRMMGIDTPERGQAGRDEATARITELVSNGITRIETFKPDKFGRWLASVYVNGPQGGELCVNTLMVTEGFAKPYDGGTKE